MKSVNEEVPFFSSITNNNNNNNNANKQERSRLARCTHGVLK